MEQENTKKQFIDTYQRAYGNVSISCKATGVGRTTFYRWLKEDPEFAAAIEALDPREDLKDFVESKLISRIKQNDTACIIFAAKTLLKDRGYIERTETVFTPGADSVINVELKIT
jgi:hypothetical protein